MLVSEIPVISDLDAIRLRTVARQLIGARGENRRHAEDLFEKLDTAEVVPASSIAADLVTMNSSVVYDDGADGIMATLTLVYPDEADIGMNRVSVLSPLGLALIGSRPGQTVTFETPDGTMRRIRVRSLVYQPEAHGDWSR